MVYFLKIVRQQYFVVMDNDVVKIVKSTKFRLM